MSARVSVLGAGGHARALVQLLLRLGYAPEGVYDDRFDPAETVLGVPLRGRPETMPDDLPCVLAVGDNGRRRAAYERLGGRVLPAPLIHPEACVEATAALGQAVQVFALACVNAAAEIGANTILNTGSIVEHEAVVGAHCHIAVRATVLGRASVSDGCFVGAGAVVRDGVRVAPGTTIGANAFVDRDLTAPGVYVGTPVRRIR